MSITSISVKRPIGSIMFFLGIIILGIMSIINMNINLLPDLNYPKITVYTEYQGSGPEEIERFITQPLEGPLSSIPGIKKVRSMSKEGISIITLEFHWGTDMDFAHLHTKEKIEEVKRQLPDDCDDPEIHEMDPSAAPIITAILRSETRSIKDLKETAEFIIKQRLEQIEGIARVEIRGGFEEEISVEINPHKIKNLGITLEEVAAAVENNNRFFSGGTVKKDKFKYTLKIEGEIQEPDEIDDIVVKKLEGRSILIKDIGHAFYKNKIRQGDIRFDASAALALLIYRESAGNTVKSTEKAETAINAMQGEFEDLEFSVISREADLIISSINSLVFSLVLGGILAVLILILFLQNFRDPILISFVIPISIVATFSLLFPFKVSINIMSLGGLVLGVGMFVDNSIIVLESIFRHRKEDNIIETVVRGAREVSGAITASTFTTISIFLPVIYLYGITGRLFRDQALSVTFSLIASLIVAITLLPALSAIKFGFKRKFYEEGFAPSKKAWFTSPLKGINTIVILPFRLLGYIFYYVISLIVITAMAISRFINKSLNNLFKPIFKNFNRLYDSFDTFYHKILDKVLEKKIIALWLSLTILAAILLTFSVLKKELLPQPKSAKFEIKATTMSKLGFVESNQIAGEIEKELMDTGMVEFLFTETGFDPKTISTDDVSVNSIHFIVKGKSPKHQSELMEKARQIIQKREENIVNFSIFLEKNSLSQYLSSGGDNFKIHVYYEDINLGKEAVGNIMDRIRDIDGINELKSTTAEGKPLFAIQFKEDLLKKLNITKDQVSNFVRQAARGRRAGELKKTLKNYDIYVRVPVTGIMDVDQLLSLPITIGTNSFHLKDLVSFTELPSIREISRDAQERFFLISGQVRGKQLNQAISQAERVLTDIDMPENTRFAFAGEEEERKKAFNSLNQAIWLAIILVYMVMAAKFENIVQPLIIMFTVPMGLIGAFLFLLISGNSLNIISGIGIMVLIGIGVNDAIVKVEYSNQMRREGMGVREAIITASKVRLRPILMTTFTTIFGLVPMALMGQAGSELQRPLAYVVIGGLLFTTFLTLILIPVCYEILENLKEKKKKKALA